MSKKTTPEKDLGDRENIAALADSENPEKTGETEHSANDSQELLLKAQKDAELAKAVAKQAISRAFRQSEASKKRAEVLAKAFDDALQGSISETQHEEDVSGTELPSQEAANSGRVKKLLDNSQNPLNVISDITKSIFHNKSVDAETRRDFYNRVLRHSKQLRELVDDLVAQQIQKRIDKAIEEAKSDRIASKLAVQQAQDEVRKAREEAEQARSEAEASRKDAEEAINIAREWLEQAKDEIAAEKKAAEVKVSQAQQQVMREAQEEIKRARDEVIAAKEAAGIAIKRAEAESREAIKEAEQTKKQIHETVIQAQQQSYQDICEEMNRIKAEAEATSKSARESITRAQEESRKAKEEAETVKKDAEEALSHAHKEIREAREEAKNAKQTLAETVVRMQEENRKIQEEAEASILMANETMKLARQDIIGMTIGEITKARQELEAASKDLNLMRDIPQKVENPAIEETANPQSETFPVDKETISPHKLITEAVQSVEETASRKKNLIILSVPSTLPAIKVDGTRIKQALHSLITNAIKSSPENSAITLRAEVRDNELLIQIKDHGIGIPPAEISAIFDEHYQATNCRDADGHGPGLHICKQIVEAHGGCIWAESVESQGNTFSFTLPLTPTDS